MDKIRKNLQEYGEFTTSDIAYNIELSPARTRVVIVEMEYVEVIGGNSNGTFRLKFLNNLRGE